MKFDIAKAKFYDLSTLFIVPAKQRKDRQFCVWSTMEQKKNIVEVSFWGAAEGEDSHILLLTLNCDLPSDDKVDDGELAALCEALTKSEDFRFCVEAAAEMEDLAPFTVKKNAKIDFGTLFSFKYTYPETLPEDCLPANLSDALMLNVSFSVDMDGNCVFAVYAYIEGYEMRVVTLEKQIKVIPPWHFATNEGDIDLSNNSPAIRSFTRDILKHMEKNAELIYLNIVDNLDLLLDAEPEEFDESMFDPCDINEEEKDLIKQIFGTIL